MNNAHPPIPQAAFEALPERVRHAVRQVMTIAQRSPVTPDDVEDLREWAWQFAEGVLSVPDLAHEFQRLAKEYDRIIAAGEPEKSRSLILKEAQAIIQAVLKSTALKDDKTTKPFVLDVIHDAAGRDEIVMGGYREYANKISADIAKLPADPIRMALNAGVDDDIRLNNSSVRGFEGLLWNHNGIDTVTRTRELIQHVTGDDALILELVKRRAAIENAVKELERLLILVPRGAGAEAAFVLWQLHEARNREQRPLLSSPRTEWEPELESAGVVSKPHNPEQYVKRLAAATKRVADILATAESRGVAARARDTAVDTGPKAGEPALRIWTQAHCPSCGVIGLEFISHAEFHDRTGVARNTVASRVKRGRYCSDASGRVPWCQNCKQKTPEGEGVQRPVDAVTRSDYVPSDEDRANMKTWVREWVSKKVGLKSFDPDLPQDAQPNTPKNNAALEMFTGILSDVYIECREHRAALSRDEVNMIADKSTKPDLLDKAFRDENLDEKPRKSDMHSDHGKPKHKSAWGEDDD